MQSVHSHDLQPSQPVTALPGVGVARAERLARLGVNTVGDLLWLIPRRHLDFSLLCEPAQASIGQGCTVWGTVIRVGARRQHKLLIVQAELVCRNGSILLTWFYAAKRSLPAPVQVGRQLAASGFISAGPNGLQMIKPIIVPMTNPPLCGRIWPVYPATAGLPQSILRKSAALATAALAHIQDPIPPSLLQKRGLPALPAALRSLHTPDHVAQITAAQRRLAYAEALLLSLAIAWRKDARQKAPASCVCHSDGQLVRAFLAGLPFALTEAQKLAIETVRSDMESGRAMQRLLHGDVGSGKTVIAVYAAVKVVENGGQAVIMAPTGIVAEQHYLRWRAILARLGIEAALVTAAEKRRHKAEEARVVFGTHAVLSLQFRSLGLVVVDEQHRFGVAQRAALASKGHPHCLCMTATPIPRSLALATWGDLDVTVLKDKPPGRTPVDTRWVTPRQRMEVYNYVRRQVDQGEQAYIIYPRIADAEENETEAPISGTPDWPYAVEEAYRRLLEGPLAGVKAGLIHGRLAPKRQEQVIRQFAAGELQVLVATPIVEVGLDVPKATIMVIEHAELFGLAQLHQLRGRVGRGDKPAVCLLVAAPGNANALARLQALRSSDDGFALAEMDLQLRGPGEMLGAVQSGFSRMEHVELPRDADILAAAVADAQAIFARDPYLAKPEHRMLQQQLLQQYPALKEEAHVCV